MTNKIKYYQHKVLPEVICEVIGGQARFIKREGSNYGECYTFKNFINEFGEAFAEITQSEFNNIWGNQLQKS